MKQKQKLFVVDDDEGVRVWLSSFASRLGYEVAVADSGEAAVETFEAVGPDLVTLDVMLPGMDGVCTLKALREIDPYVPVIMLSGTGQTRTIVEAIKHGASDFLRKPFEPEELEVAFNKALTRMRLER